MGRGRNIGLRVAATLVVALAAGALGILMPTLSNTVEKDTQVSGQAITLTVDGIPATVAPGDVFRVVATMANNANRPIPAVLRFEVRNPNGTTPSELTVYSGCGAEEIVNTLRLRYYVGWHGPLLAAKGSSFAAGTTAGTVAAAVGGADYWPMVLREIEERDPSGYASLIAPGSNASAGVQGSTSGILKVLNYYGMLRIASGASDGSTNLADWILTMPFSDRIVADGDRSQDGFLVEVHPQSRGSFEFKFWAERPDGFGIPSHPYTCGPL